jgi:hypothetical protein
VARSEKCENAEWTALQIICSSAGALARIVALREGDEEISSMMARHECSLAKIWTAMIGDACAIKSALHNPVINLSGCTFPHKGLSPQVFIRKNCKSTKAKCGSFAQSKAGLRRSRSSFPSC